MSALPREAPKDSLLLGNGTQLALLPEQGDELPDGVFARQEQRGIFTAERLFNRNPRLYHAIVKLLGKAETFWSIADILSVSVNTVRAVRDREGVAIDTEKTRIGQVALDVARLSFETLHARLADPEERAKLRTTDLGIIAGIATEKAQLLLGAPTAIIASTETAAPGHDDYLRLLAGLKNVTGTGYSAESGATKERSALPGPTPAINVPSAPVQPPERAGPTPNV